MVDSDQQKGPSSNGPLFHVGGYVLKYKEKIIFRVLYDMLLRGKHLTPVMDC
jgi:hypothetical protein